MRFFADDDKPHTVLFAPALFAFSAMVSGCATGTIDNEAEADPAEEAVAEAAQELSWNGHSYWFRPEPTTWLMARNACAVRPDYYLVTISSDAEQLHLEQTASDMGGWWWIGYNDRITEGLWKWVQGGSKIESWASGHPDQDATARDCAYMRPNGYWYAGECTGKHRYICERNY